MTRVPRVGPSRFRLTTLAIFAACLVPAAAVITPVEARAPQDRPPLVADASFDDRDWSGDVPAHLAVVDGRATIERDGRMEDAAENIPLLAGDRLRTERGRVEVLYADGSTLDIDEYSNVDLLDDSLIRLGGGRIRLAIARTSEALTYRVDAAGATAWIRSAGEYRIAITDPRAQYPEVTLAVLRGSAELATPLGRTLVRAGTAAATTARTEPSRPFSVNAASGDAFDRWAEDQRNERLGYESARYLPTEIQYYSGYFDRAGSWEYQPTYGYVWYPRVAVDWQPYYDGNWSVFGSFGWFWVGAGRWSYPTHHYGRWGYSGRWYWIPGRQWGPAWVSWAYAPGYVGWCPLGYNGRPVYGFGGGYGYGYRDHGRGWSVAPSHAFNNRAVARNSFVAGERIGSASTQFVERRVAPTRPGSIRTDVGPIRSPGATSRRVAVSRTGNAAGAPLGPGATPAGRSLSPMASVPSPGVTGTARSRTPLSERGPMIDQQERRTPASRTPITRSLDDTDRVRGIDNQTPDRRAVERRAPAPTSLPGSSRPEPSSSPLGGDRTIAPSRRVSPMGRPAPPIVSTPDDVRGRSIEPRTFSSAPPDRPQPDRSAPSRFQRPVDQPRSQPGTSRPAPSDRGGAGSRVGSSAPESAPANSGSRAPSRVAQPRGGDTPRPAGGGAARSRGGSR